jgi:hypothetical protein
MPESIEPAAQISPPQNQPYIQPRADITTVLGIGSTMSPTISAIPANHAHRPYCSIHFLAPSRLSIRSNSAPQIMKGTRIRAKRTKTRSESDSVPRLRDMSDVELGRSASCLDSEGRTYLVCKMGSALVWILEQNLHLLLFLWYIQIDCAIFRPDKHKVYHD